MSAFFASFASYLIKMIILIALGICGGFIVIKLRQNSNRKNGIDDTISEPSSNE